MKGTFAIAFVIVGIYVYKSHAQMCLANNLGNTGNSTTNQCSSDNLSARATHPTTTASTASVFTPNTLVANPINVLSGNKFEQADDLIIDQNNPYALNLTRYYNSQSAQRGIFGVGWRSNFEIQLQHTADTIQILSTDGTLYHFDQTQVSDKDNPINAPLIAPRFQEAPLSRTDLPEIDVVLISHDHYDHLEATTMRYLADKAKRFVVPLGVGARLQSWGVPQDKITELGWGDSTDVGTIRLTAETTQHYTSRFTNDRNKTLWASFVLDGSRRLYWMAIRAMPSILLILGQNTARLTSLLWR